MTMSDPIADMLTRIRNANTAKHDTVDIPSSKMKIAIANILLDEGYIRKYEMVDNGNFQDIPGRMLSHTHHLPTGSAGHRKKDACAEESDDEYPCHAIHRLTSFRPIEEITGPLVILKTEELLSAHTKGLHITIDGSHQEAPFHGICPNKEFDLPVHDVVRIVLRNVLTI